MPKRSNEKQQVIEMLKAMTTANGWTVTPSKLLRDHRIDEEREVDIVLEKEDDGQLFTQCLEVVGKGRPATLNWVQEMVRKHQDMQTDRLFLVSWSGFTASALKEVRQHMWVTATVPQAIDHDKPNSVAMLAEEVRLKLTKWAVFAQDSDGSLRQLAVSSDSVVYSGEGRVMAHPESIAWELIRRPSFGARVIDEAGNLAKADSAPGRYEAMLSVDGPPGMFLSFDGLPENLEPIAQIGVAGESFWSRQSIDMTLRTLDKHRFKHGTADILGTPMVIVAALDDDLKEVAVKAEPKKGGKRKTLRGTKKQIASPPVAKPPKRGPVAKPPKRGPVAKPPKSKLNRSKATMPI